MRRVLIFGTGENGFQAYHIFRRDAGVEVVGFLDDNPSRHGSEVLGRPVLGSMDAVAALRDSHGVDAGIVAVGDNVVRARKFSEMRAAGLPLINAIHPQAIVDDSAQLGGGIIIEMGVAVHPGARIGDGVFLGGGAVISHHSSVGAFALIAGGVIFGGHVTVGAFTLLGVGVAIQPHVTIGRNVVVGVGAAIVGDLPDDVVAVGVPARVVKQRAPLAS